MKSHRQAVLLEIIREYDIDTQEELLDKLREKNFNVTQATISRDINELKLIKVPVANGKYKYTVAQKDEKVFAAEVIDPGQGCAGSRDHIFPVLIIEKSVFHSRLL